MVTTGLIVLLLIFGISALGWMRWQNRMPEWQVMVWALVNILGSAGVMYYYAMWVSLSDGILYPDAAEVFWWEFICLLRSGIPSDVALEAFVNMWNSGELPKRLLELNKLPFQLFILFPAMLLLLLVVAYETMLEHRMHLPKHLRIARGVFALAFVVAGYIGLTGGYYHGGTEALAQITASRNEFIQQLSLYKKQFANISPEDAEMIINTYIIERDLSMDQAHYYKFFSMVDQALEE